jgi:hypothetical protein
VFVIIASMIMAESEGLLGQSMPSPCGPSAEQR